MKGTIKWFNTTNGYGFITGEDGKDYFLHMSALPQQTQPKDGQEVEFTPEQGDRGPLAKNVVFR